MLVLARGIANFRTDTYHSTLKIIFAVQINCNFSWAIKKQFWKTTDLRNLVLFNILHCTERQTLIYNYLRSKNNWSLTYLYKPVSVSCFFFVTRISHNLNLYLKNIYIEIIIKLQIFKSKYPIIATGSLTNPFFKILSRSML